MDDSHYKDAQLVWDWPRFRVDLEEVLDLLAFTDRLDEISERSTSILLRSLSWPGQTIRSEALAAREDRSRRLADLSSAAGADTYLCGEGGMRCLDQTPFYAAGIAVVPFRTPATDSSPIWNQARRITGLWALMTTGPAALRPILGSTR